jgi:diguanylate cyclase (GGDEF)-like protein
LSNRRGFNQFARFTLSVAKRRAEPLTLGWLDLDRFKEINDRYGHEEGDNALKAMAQLMRSSFREADLLVRFGGDELPCCLPIRMSRGLDCHAVSDRAGRSIQRAKAASVVVTVHGD